MNWWKLFILEKKEQDNVFHAEKGIVLSGQRVKLRI